MYHRKLYCGGEIITCNLRDEVAEAMVTEDDRILYVGEYREARFLCDADTEVCRMDGGAILPGFFSDFDILTEETLRDGFPDAVRHPASPDADINEGLCAEHAGRGSFDFAAYCFSRGITTVTDADSIKPPLFRRLQRGGDAVFAGPRRVLDMRSEGDAPTDADNIGAAGLCTGFGNEELRVGAVRLPVREEDTYHASFPSWLAARIRRFTDIGLGVALAPVGERAQRMAVSAYRAAVPHPTGRDRILLCCDPPERTADEIAVAHLCVSIRAIGLLEPSPTEPPRLSRLAARGIPLLLSTEGLPPRLGAPLLLLAAAQEGRAYSPLMRNASLLPPVQTLRMLTLSCAKAAGTDRMTGSLEWGKKADFVWLAASPLRLSPDRIRRLAVRRTVKDGKTVWYAPQPASVPARETLPLS